MKFQSGTTFRHMDSPILPLDLSICTARASNFRCLDVQFPPPEWSIFAVWNSNVRRLDFQFVFSAKLSYYHCLNAGCLLIGSNKNLQHGEIKKMARWASGKKQTTKRRINSSSTAVNNEPLLKGSVRFYAC